MKKLLLSFAVIATSAIYIAYQYIGGGSASASVLSTQTTVTTTSAQEQTPAPLPVASSTPSAFVKPKGQYVDGIYTGRAISAYYGNIQVQATIEGGKLADVTFLQYPSDHRTSLYINSQAMPVLRQEAIRAQSATVAGVSGASDTSAAFRKSLGNALALAKS